MNNKSFFISVAILTITAIITLHSFIPKFEKKTVIKMSDFPKTIEDWSSEDVPLSERVYKLLETKNLIMRNYKNKNGDKVNFYIIYSPENRRVAHPPEICLQGEGATVTDKMPLQITNSIKATRLIIEKDASTEMVIYWYKVGRLNTDSYIKQQLKVVVDRLFGRETSVALIRILTEIENDKQSIALSKIKKFCTLIEPLLDKYVP